MNNEFKEKLKIKQPAFFKKLKQQQKIQEDNSELYIVDAKENGTLGPYVKKDALYVIEAYNGCATMLPFIPIKEPIKEEVMNLFYIDIIHKQTKATVTYGPYSEEYTKTFCSAYGADSQYQAVTRPRDEKPVDPPVVNKNYYIDIPGLSSSGPYDKYNAELFLTSFKANGGYGATMRAAEDAPPPHPQAKLIRKDDFKPEDATEVRKTVEKSPKIEIKFDNSDKRMDELSATNKLLESKNLRLQNEVTRLTNRLKEVSQIKAGTTFSDHYATNMVPLPDNIVIDRTNIPDKIEIIPTAIPVKETPGFIVVHQHVGSLPPHKAEALCDRVKDQFTKGKQWADFKEKFPSWNFLLIPTRTEDSRVEVYHEDKGVKKQIIGEICRRTELEEPAIKDSDELRERTIDYVLLMLGAPVVKLELTEDQLNFCYYHTLNLLHDTCAHMKKFTMLESYYAQSEEFFKNGVLAHAMMILGRIRQHKQQLPVAERWHNPTSDEDMFLAVRESKHPQLTPDQLYEEGKEKLANWKKALKIPFVEEKKKDKEVASLIEGISERLEEGIEEVRDACASKDQTDMDVIDDLIADIDHMLMDFYSKKGWFDSEEELDDNRRV